MDEEKKLILGILLFYSFVMLKNYWDYSQNHPEFLIEYSETKKIREFFNKTDYFGKWQKEGSLDLLTSSSGLMESNIIYLPERDFNSLD